MKIVPNRIIKESICTSDTLASISAAAERLWWRLVVQADDYGRYDARPKTILGKCLTALIGQASEADVARWLDELENAGLIRRYVVDGRPYLSIVKWAEHQSPPRAKKPKFPQPPSHDSTCEHMRADANTRKQMPEDAPDIRESGIGIRDSGCESRHPQAADDDGDRDDDEHGPTQRPPQADGAVPLGPRIGPDVIEPPEEMRPIAEAYFAATGRPLAPGKDLQQVREALKIATVEQIVRAIQRGAERYRPAYEGDKIRGFGYFLPIVREIVAEDESLIGVAAAAKAARASPHKQAARDLSFLDEGA